MIAPPLAHVGHWYHALLYLAPVVLIALALWVQDRRQGDYPLDDDLDDDDLDDDLFDDEPGSRPTPPDGEPG